MVLTVFALTMSVAAAVNADLSGTWKLDAAKSTGLPPGMEQTMIITQTGDALNLETVVKGGPQGEQTVKDSYVLDGKETDLNLPNGKGKRTSKRSADGIEVSEKAEVKTPDGATVNIEVTRKWTLAADGKSLTIEQKVKTPSGEQEFKRLFIKQ